MFDPWTREGAGGDVHQTRNPMDWNWKTIALAISMGLLVGGCRGSTIVAGNVTSMLIVVVMLWSTLNMNRS